MIPYGRQTISEEDIAAVNVVLKSDWLTQGPQVPIFEKEVARYVGGKFGIAVNSATSALHIAVMALGVGKGDILWTTPNTFVASANCGLFCGAEVDFVDIDLRTFNIDVDCLAFKLEAASRQGLQCDIQQIRKLADKYGFFIIEDASHAIGASFSSNKPFVARVNCGACTHSDVTVFSFHPVKILTTGEGGMAVTNNQEYADKMLALRQHGIIRDTKKKSPEWPGDWYYEQKLLGYNYRMTDIAAALGRSQLNRVEEFVDRRNELAELYKRKLVYKDMEVTCQEIPDGYRSAYHLFVVLLPGSSDERRLIFDSMRAKDILVNVHYIPIYRQPYFQQMGFDRHDYPNSENYYSRCLTLPLYPAMHDAQVDEVVDALEAALAQ